MLFRFCNHELNSESGQITGPDGPITLRRQTFRLLEVLVEHAPNLVPRDQLLDQVWGRSALSANVLPQAISELRQALGDQAQSPLYIETMHRRGYRMACTVERVGTIPSEPIPSPAEPLPPPTTNSVVNQKAAIGLSILLILAGSIMWWLWPDTPDAQVAEKALIPGSDRSAIALGIFSQQPEVPDWVAPAALEMLTRQLAADERLVVLRSDGLGPSMDASSSRWQLMARELLGAPLAISGQWRLAGNHDLQLDVNLIDLHSGRILRSGQFSGPVSDLDALIAHTADDLRDYFELPEIRPMHSQPLTTSQRQVWWQALADLNQGKAQEAASALEELHQSIDQHAWLAPYLARALNQAGRRQEAIAVLESARNIVDPRQGLGSALRLRAELARLKFQPAEAAMSLRALTALFPDDTELALNLAEAELDSLNSEAARATLEQIDKHPLLSRNPRLLLLQARLARLEGQFEQALHLVETTWHLSVEFQLPALSVTAALELAGIHQQLGQYQEALATLTRVDDQWPGIELGQAQFEVQLQRARILRVMGNYAQTGETLESILASEPPSMIQHRVGIEQAVLKSEQGDFEGAMLLLDEVSRHTDWQQDHQISIAFYSAQGQVLAQQGKAAEAREILTKAQTLATRTGRGHELAGVQVNIGLVLARQRRFEEADRLWEQALVVFEKVADQRGIGLCLSNLAASAAARGHEQRAQELNERALDIFRAAGMNSQVARTSFNLGLLAGRQGRLRQAQAYFDEARRNFLDNDNHSFALAAGARQADVLIARGELDLARDLLTELQPLVDPATTLHQADWHAAWARLYKWTGDAVAASAAFAMTHELHVEANNPAWIASTEVQKLHIDLLSGSDPTNVRMAAEQILRTDATGAEPRLRALVLALIAETYLQQSRLDEARIELREAHSALAGMPDVLVETRLAWLDAWSANSPEREARLENLARRMEELELYGRLEQLQHALKPATLPIGEQPRVGLLPQYVVNTLNPE
jgi:tetratricopeptide (TPR) repeat protein